MSSIRPLITITILVVVGVVLYVKINEAPPQPAPSADDAWSQPVDGVPPLAASSVAPTTTEGAAPAWPATPVAPATADVAPAEIAPAETVAAPTNAVVASAPGATPANSVPPVAENVPAVPTIPPLAEVAAAAPPASTPITTPPLPTSLPANVPEARYPEQTVALETPAPSNTTTAPLEAQAPAASAFAPAPAPTATTSPTAESVATPEQMNAATAAVSGIPTTPGPLDANPLRSTTEVLPTDRYGTNLGTTAPSAETPAAATSPATNIEQSFADSWPAIQAMLDRGELTEAHKALSRWCADPSLTPTDAERVDTLLSQLAGTVVYSTEHRLAPAYVVKQGETLETIATEHDVPWQLLAKINGVTTPDQVRVGQELKVVRGPFSAVVDLTRSQLYLSVDERYAGRFPVTVTPGQSISEGEWVVGRKSNEQAPGRALLLQGNSSAAGAPAPQLVIASDSIPVSSADGTVIKIAAKDADELSDILSVGSRVITRR